MPNYELNNQKIYIYIYIIYLHRAFYLMVNIFIFLVICDNQQTEIIKEKLAYSSITTKYLFLLKLDQFSAAKVYSFKSLRELFFNDLEGTYFEEECV